MLHHILVRSTTTDDRGRRRRLLLLLTLLSCIAIACSAGIAAASCDDIELSYCNKVITPGTWCAQGAGSHTYSTNSAHYDGTGTTYVCERILGHTSHQTYSFQCANTAAYGNIGANCDAFMDIAVQNESSFNHTIRGAASY